MRSIIFSTLLVMAAAHTSRTRIPTSATNWKLPPKHGEIESIACFVSNLPRGGQNYDGNDDDWRYQDDNRYGGDYYGDDGRYGDDYYDDRGSAPSVCFNLGQDE